MKNEPYIKQYDENGKIANPIEGIIIPKFPNRRERRQHLNETRFMGNTKGVCLTVVKIGKYLRIRQPEIDKSGKPKLIDHYLLQ